MRMRVADYIAKTLADHGIRRVFMVTGGGAMHLNDAIGREKRMSWVCCHHEQACAMAAESYFRLTGRLAAVNVTTGPGGTNAITGVYGAWTDSLGMIVISGQVRTETLVRSHGLPLRQLGDQEIDITRLVAPITKYAEMITDPTTVRYHLERALHLAISGRPGPVWLDVPMNVQGAFVTPEELPGYDPAEDADARPSTDLEAVAADLLARLRRAERPVILAGSGVRIAGEYGRFLELVERLGIPVATAFNAHDLLADDHPLYVGRPGTVGDRPGNFAVQNADFVLVLGCRLNIRQISYNWGSWARAAYKAMVDVDAAELAKPTLAIDCPVHADLKDFYAAVRAAEWAGPTEAQREYLAWCQARRTRYPVVSDAAADSALLNPYTFADALFEQLPDDAVVVTGDGTACVVTFQSARIRAGQRLYSNSGSAPMGYDLPAAIGACFGRQDETGALRQVVCLAGDGSLQMNVQELQTIATHRLPIVIFVINNNGYLSIRQTQQNFFADNPIGCDPGSGVGFPDLAKLADAYGIPYMRLAQPADLTPGLRAALATAGPLLCEVVVDPQQAFAPKLSSRRLPDGRMVSSPLEDMAPFLSREELAENMRIPLLEP